MGYSQRILADSISEAGHRITTFELTMPRVVLAEFNTHRMLSRNSASSRAIPVGKMLARVKDDPFVPVHWGKNQKGMAAEEEFTGEDRGKLDDAWRGFSIEAAENAAQLVEFGVHKQITNRLLEPWLWQTIVVTATDWSNLWHLRDSDAAMPEIRTSIAAARRLYEASTPKLVARGWHLPLVDEEEWLADTRPMLEWAKISSARCARVSYLTHDGRRDPEEDLKLYERLVAPGHMSPLEHACRPMYSEELDLFRRPLFQWNESRETWTFVRNGYYLGNVEGWVQLRKMIPGEWDIVGERLP